MVVSLVVAMARNRVIGRANRLPWHLPAELAHFKRVTMGRPIVMGRRTFESIGKALPGRLNIVVSRNRAFLATGCVVVASLEAAVTAAGDAEEMCVIGGTSLFREALAIAHRIHLTRVEADVPGDTYFPEFDLSQWNEKEITHHAADDRHAFPFTILQLDRR